MAQPRQDMSEYFHESPAAAAGAPLLEQHAAAPSLLQDGCDPACVRDRGVGLAYGSGSAPAGVGGDVVATSGAGAGDGAQPPAAASPKGGGHQIAAATADGHEDCVSAHDAVQSPPHSQGVGAAARGQAQTPHMAAAVAGSKSSYFEEHAQTREDVSPAPRHHATAEPGAAEAADVGAASSDAATACPQDDAQPEEAAQSELAGASSHGASRPSSRASSTVSGPIDREDNARHGPAPSEGKEEQDDPGNTRAGAQGSAREAAAHSSTREVASAGASATAAAVESLLALSGVGTAPEAGARDSHPNAEPEPAVEPRATRSARKRGKEAATDDHAMPQTVLLDTCAAGAAHQGGQHAEMEEDDSSSGDEVPTSIFLPKDLPILCPKKKRHKARVQTGSDAVHKPESDVAWNRHFDALKCWLKRHGHPHPYKRCSCRYVDFFCVPAGLACLIVAPSPCSVSDPQWGK